MDMIPINFSHSPLSLSKVTPYVELALEQLELDEELPTRKPLASY